MEPGIFMQLKRLEIVQSTCIEYYLIVISIFSYRYFQAGGNPGQVINLCPENYHAVVQTANLLAERLIIMAGDVKFILFSVSVFKNIKS